MRREQRNVCPALVTTIVVLLVTLAGLFFVYRSEKDSEHSRTGDDPEPRAFVDVQGQNMANALSNESVRLAGTLHIPEQAFPVPNTRQRDRCYDLKTIGQIGESLT